MRIWTPGGGGGGGGAGSGWKTIVDVDFTAQPSQTLSPDGTYTIGGTHFTKVNSANDATPMALVNGQGIIVQPVAATDYFAGTFSLPGLRWNLAQAPGFAYGLPVRVWAFVSAQNIAANFDAWVVGFETVNAIGTPVLNTLLKRCFDSSGGGGQKWLSADNANGGNIFQITDSQNLTDNVGVVEAVDGVPFNFAKLYSATFPGGDFPPSSSFFGHCNMNPTPVNISADSAADPFQPILPTAGTSGWNAFIGAQRSGSATPLSITFARFKVEVHY